MRVRLLFCHDKPASRRNTRIKESIITHCITYSFLHHTTHHKTSFFHQFASHFLASFSIDSSFHRFLIFISFSLFFLSFPFSFITVAPLFLSSLRISLFRSQFILHFIYFILFSFFIFPCFFSSFLHHNTVTP